MRARIGWQALRNAGGRIDVVADGGYRQVDGGNPTEMRAGGGASASGALGAGAVTATLDGERRWLDQSPLAWNAGLLLGIALPVGLQMVLPEVEARVWRFADQSDANGVLVSARYRHWLPLVDGDPRNRAELGVEAGRFQADSGAETYGEARIDAGLRGRAGPDHGAGRWDFAAGAWYEHRDYHEGLRARSGWAGANGSLDRWLDAQLALGLEAGWDRIADQPGGGALDELQASVRATAAF